MSTLGTLESSKDMTVERFSTGPLARRTPAPPPAPAASAAWLLRTNRELPVDLRSLDRLTRGLKRAVDLGVATAMLVTLAPLMAVVAMVVRIASPGPAIFSQVRVGLNLRRNQSDRRAAHNGTTVAENRRSGSDRRQQSAYGKPFVLYKFRTMRLDAEKDGAQFARQGDPRVTPLGRFLRKSRLDELPQLWNVLKGEMSLVGPRPERPEFICDLSREIPEYCQRLRLKPGLTGVAQIVNGYDNNIESFRRKVALDLLYIRHCSFSNDVQILLRTVGVVLTGKGAL
jgi:lipopolysaccharide/colanic/teichoic acid biosynthesis glycosyltransferase